jgi:TetR/AcrR family transcriptional repressor of nem operon
MNATSVTTKGRKAAATRDHILDVASRLIHLQGYHSTALDDVLRESGVGKGSFYYYFKSKEDLGYAIIDRVMMGMVERTLQPILGDPTGDPIKQIHAFLDRVRESQRQRNCVGGCPIGNLASELSDVHEGFRVRLAAIFAEWRARLTEALLRGQTMGRMRLPRDPSAIAQFLVAALEGAILLTKVSKDIGVMERCVEELKEHLTLYTTDCDRGRSAPALSARRRVL